VPSSTCPKLNAIESHLPSPDNPKRVGVKSRILDRGLWGIFDTSVQIRVIDLHSVGVVRLLVVDVVVGGRLAGHLVVHLVDQLLTLVDHLAVLVAAQAAAAEQRVLLSLAVCH